MWIPILFLRKWYCILVTHSCWLLDTMFDHLLWLIIRIFYQSCQSTLRIINIFLNHLIKHYNKMVVDNRITGEIVDVNVRSCLFSPQFTRHCHHIWLDFVWKMSIFHSISSDCSWSASSQLFGLLFLGHNLDIWFVISTFVLRFPAIDLYTFIFAALFPYTHWILPHLLHYWLPSGCNLYTI